MIQSCHLLERIKTYLKKRKDETYNKWINTMRVSRSELMSCPLKSQTILSWRLGSASASQRKVADFPAATSKLSGGMLILVFSERACCISIQFLIQKKSNACMLVKDLELKFKFLLYSVYSIYKQYLYFLFGKGRISIKSFSIFYKWNNHWKSDFVVSFT